MISIIEHRLSTWLKPFGILCALCILALTGCSSASAPTPLESSPEPTLTITMEVPSPVASTELPGTSVPSPETCTIQDESSQTTFKEIGGQVRKIRGREYNPDPQEIWLTQEQLQERVLSQFYADYSKEQALKESVLLAFLGLIEPGTDLRTLYADILQEQAAGFYDNADGVMVLLCDQISGLERVTYAHEYAHFLQDQLYDLEIGFDLDPESCAAETDRCTATRSLLEGEATLLQEQWMRTFGNLEDIGGLIEFFASYEMPAFASAPPFIQDDLTFSYLAGMEFVHHFYLKDSWAAVDEIFESPPVSTEQIMHPTRYPKDLPVEMELPDFEGVSDIQWKVFDRGRLGEWRLLATLDKYLPPDVADQAAEGWGGDRYIILTSEPGNRDSFVLVTQWDTMRDAHEFYSALRTYGDTRYGEPSEYTVSTARWDFPDQSVLIQLVSNQAAWIISPSPETTEALSSALELPIRP